MQSDEEVSSKGGCSLGQTSFSQKGEGEERKRSGAEEVGHKAKKLQLNGQGRNLFLRPEVLPVVHLDMRFQLNFCTNFSLV